MLKLITGLLFTVLKLCPLGVVKVVMAKNIALRR